jgi:NitT/TauT family transport system substrate-binding protein
MTYEAGIGRRRLLLGAAVGVAGYAAFRAPLVRAADTVNMQLGWLVDYNQTGELVAQALGYYEQEKMTLVVQPGGSNIDGVAIVASGQCEIGQTPSSAALMMASSHDIPVIAFAAGAQRHPFAFFSLPKSPVRTPQDMVGKKIGIQSTSQVLLNALLKKNGIDPSKIEVVIVGYDMVPLLSGQVDAISGWVIDVGVLKSLGPDFVTMSLWDTGIHLYSDVYYTTHDMAQRAPDQLARFLRATARGWQYTYENRDKAVEILVKANSNLQPAETRSALDALLKYEFNEETKKNGWGTMSPQVWQEQIDVYKELNQFTAKVPTLSDMMTTAILEATAGDRPKFG